MILVPWRVAGEVIYRGEAQLIERDGEGPQRKCAALPEVVVSHSNRIVIRVPHGATLCPCLKCARKRGEKRA